MLGAPYLSPAAVHAHVVGGLPTRVSGRKLIDPPPLLPFHITRPPDLPKRCEPRSPQSTKAASSTKPWRRQRPHPSFLQSTIDARAKSLTAVRHSLLVPESTPSPSPGSFPTSSDAPESCALESGFSPTTGFPFLHINALKRFVLTSRRHEGPKWTLREPRVLGCTQRKRDSR